MWKERTRVYFPVVFQRRQSCEVTDEIHWRPPGTLSNVIYATGSSHPFLLPSMVLASLHDLLQHPPSRKCIGNVPQTGHTWDFRILSPLDSEDGGCIEKAWDIQSSEARYGYACWMSSTACQNRRRANNSGDAAGVRSHETSDV